MDPLRARRPPALTANAREVLERRYLRRDRDGHCEDVDTMFRRVADTVAAADTAYGASRAEVSRLADRFFARMRGLEFLPNSPTLMNAGRALGQLAACFVVPVEDSTEGIFEAVGWAAEIQKSGGGTGFSFSSLRPAGDPVESTGGVAAGPVAFMQVFDVATDAIRQGGTRRGANMGILRVDHPDILDFISIKLAPGKMQNFNLSVAVTDGFMTAVKRGERYPLVNPRSGAVVRHLDAKRVFSAIANAAWSTGDPGLVFLDRINRDNPTPALGAIAATNPCGEQPLLPFESCTLGSLNLARFVSPGANPVIAWRDLAAAVADGVHFLDNVIDINRYPLDEIATATRQTRKVGLGVMGFADLLIELGIPYHSPEAQEIGRAVAELLERESLAESQRLAQQRGPFPAWPGSVWGQRQLRNAATTTVAPTGTVSIIAGCSSGIEPLFAVAYRRHVLDGQVLVEVHPGFRARAEAGGYWSDQLAEALFEQGHARGVAGVPEPVQRLFVTAHELEPSIHLEMQATFQRHIHAAVSKTINLPHQASPSDVEAAFRLAHQLECKGVTIYRDRSRASQVLAFGAPSGATPNPDLCCPACDAVVDRHASCRVCRSCGWSVCG